MRKKTDKQINPESAQEPKPAAPKTVDAAGAKTILSADMRNIAKKVLAGRPLNQNERRIFKSMAGAAKPTLPERIGENVRKGTQYETDYARALRMAQVFRMRLQGFTLEEIGEKIGISKRTCIEMMKSMDAEFRAEIDTGQAQKIVSSRLRQYEVLRNMAWQCLGELGPEDNQARVSFMKILTDISEKEMKLLQDAGVFTQAPLRIEQTGADGGPMAVITANQPLPPASLANWLSDYAKRTNK